MNKDYKINKQNSTVCGSPGRRFDWSLFCWDGSEIRIDICLNPPHKHEIQAPLPWEDSAFICEGNQYLHVPYDWAEQGCIYWVRPNESMRAGKVYRGKLINKQTAIKKDDGWYWRLFF